MPVAAVGRSLLEADSMEGKGIEAVAVSEGDIWGLAAGLAGIFDDLKRSFDVPLPLDI
jgi:hypothetical protein